MEERIPVIIDTDPGVDDALAIMIAAASEKIQLLGITPVDGNVPAAYTHQNALDLVQLFRLNIPVAKGSFDQLVYRVPRNSSAHGKTGMGTVVLPKSEQPYDELYAWDFIYEKAKAYSGELVLVCIGPLTNIARAIIMHPDLKDHVKEIVMMGGSTTRGNVTPYAEFNYWVDPPAAKVVFESGIPLVMAGLNVTLKTGISFDFIEQLEKENQTVISSLVNQWINSYADVQVNKEGERSSVVHDALAVGYVIAPEKFETENLRIEMGTHRFQEGNWGQSEVVEGEPNCIVITDMDMDFYRELYRASEAYFSDITLEG